MGTTREIRVGKIAGKNSYELAVESGVFSGTLAEYLAKEQKAYDDMVTYGSALKAEIETLVHPRYDFSAEVSTADYAVANQATEMYYNKISYNL